MSVISPRDIRKGDLIRITRTVEGHVTEVFGDFTVEIDGQTRSLMPLDALVGSTLELLDRPLNLPTKPGSVIDVAITPGSKSRWFLQESLWVSSYGSNRSAQSLKDWLQTNGFTFEVIA